MSITRKLKLLLTIFQHPGMIISQSNQILVLSHMRSRSSVLSHILGSNYGISGYGELHISYRHYLDMLKMKVKLHHDLGCEIKNRYLLDKLLHNRYEIAEKHLNKLVPKVIFLLRRPEETFKSTIKMGHQIGRAWYKDPEKVLEYYCLRLKQLEEYAVMMNGKYFFIESDEIIEKTDEILKGLTEWLDLANELSDQYLKFKKTGKPGYGDSSGNIFKGVVGETEKHQSIHIPLEILDVANLAYERCKNSIIGNRMDTGNSID